MQQRGQRPTTPSAHLPALCRQKIYLSACADLQPCTDYSSAKLLSTFSLFRRGHSPHFSVFACVCCVTRITLCFLGFAEHFGGWDLYTHSSSFCSLFYRKALFLNNRYTDGRLTLLLFLFVYYLIYTMLYCLSPPCVHA